MHRGAFLTRALGAVSGLVLGRYADLEGLARPTAVPPPAVSATAAARELRLVAAGGLCAPLEPSYAMPAFELANAHPLRALPRFTAARGGVAFAA